jgi:predicted transcriptional regulator
MNMEQKTIAVRLTADKQAALERLAEALGQDLDAVVNAALDMYVEQHLAEVEHITQGLAEAESGAEGLAHDEVFRRLRARIEERLVSSD